MISFAFIAGCIATWPVIIPFITVFIIFDSISARIAIICGTMLLISISYLLLPALTLKFIVGGIIYFAIGLCTSLQRYREYISIRVACYKDGDVLEKEKLLKNLHPTNQEMSEKLLAWCLFWPIGCIIDMYVFYKYTRNKSLPNG